MRSHLILAMALVFAALAPVLTTPELGRTLENLNVETALEARRDGHWLMPTLEGQLRTKKPPLAAWITALAMRPHTVANLASRSPTVRDAAYRRLAWQARWPALVQMGLALVAVYLLGSTLEVGAEAAMLCGASYLFLRYAQVSQTDGPLALWVILANAAFAVAVFQRRRWVGAIGAGLALGLAFMSKGPVAFAQTLGPWMIWALWQRPAIRKALGPTIAGIAMGLLIAIPWYLVVWIKDPYGQAKVWFNEITGNDAPDRGKPFYGYLAYLPTFLPMALFAIPGIGAVRKSPRRSQLALMICLVVVPLVIQSFFKDKEDRYLLPLLGPMAVLAGVGLQQAMTWRNAKVAAAYWIVLAAAPIGLAVMGAVGWPKPLRGVDGGPWFNWVLSATVIGVTLVIFVGALKNHAWRSERVALFTLLFMVLFMHVVTLGYYGRSISGKSRMRPLAEKIWADYPDARLCTTEPFGRRASEDLSIYADRLTEWITPQDVMNATPGLRPMVVLMSEKRGMRTPLPAGWRDLMQLPQDSNDTWRAVVLPAKIKSAEGIP